MNSVPWFVFTVRRPTMFEVQFPAPRTGTGTVTHPAVLLPLRAARDAAYPDTEHVYTPLTSVVSAVRLVP